MTLKRGVGTGREIFVAILQTVYHVPQGPYTKGVPRRDYFLVGISVSLCSHHSPCSSPHGSLKPKRRWRLEENTGRGELRALAGCDEGTLALGMVSHQLLAGAKPTLTLQFASDAVESGKVSQVSVLLALKPLCTLRT